MTHDLDEVLARDPPSRREVRQNQVSSRSFYIQLIPRRGALHEETFIYLPDTKFY
jgi:hypothetical protein